MIRQSISLYMWTIIKLCYNYKFNQKEIMLAPAQKAQLNADILEYLVKNHFASTAQNFARQLGVSLTDVDPQSNRLQLKWKSISILQRKLSNLQQQVEKLQQILKITVKKEPIDINTDNLLFPITPPKFALKGHRCNITSIAFHPQSSTLATSSQDGSIKIWQFQTGELEKTLRGHKNPVNYVSYDRQGRYLASCSSDFSIKLWDINNHYICFKTLNGHQHNVSYVNFNLEGDFLYSCSRDKTIKLWEVNTGQCKRTFSGHEGWVRRLSISKDGQTFVSGSNDQSVIVWNINSEQPILRFFSHENAIETLILIEGEASSKLFNSQFLRHKLAPEQRTNALKQKGANDIINYLQTFIITGGSDKLIKLFLCQTGQLLHTFYGHENWVRSLSLQPNGKYLYSASDDKTIRTWDLNDGKQRIKIDAHDHFVSDVKVNEKYGVLGSCGNDMVVYIWNLRS